MEAQETSSSSNPNTNSKEPFVCEECSLNPWKYRCPGCSIRSCSLPCVKSHKKRTSCSGKRPRTEFVPISQFDDNLLISDYNLLEEAKRVAETAQRMRERRDKSFSYTYFKLPATLKALKNAAGSRKTRLLFFPDGMLKRQKNQSRYDQRKKSISWTIEWRFHSTDVVIVDDGVDENTNLSSVIEKNLKLGPYKNKLRPFCEEQLDHLKFFIRKNPMGSKSPFHELDIKSGISRQLAHVTILEYPVIHVFLPSATFDFEIIRDVKHFPEKTELGEPVNNDDVPSPKGVLFKEEEIEEDDDGFPMDPQILDLMKFMNSEPLDVKPLLSGEAETEDNNDLYTSSGFDFEQNLRDIYSDLLGDVNPDDFLNLDGGFQLEGDLDEGLEEGEIPGF